MGNVGQVHSSRGLRHGDGLVSTAKASGQKTRAMSPRTFIPRLSTIALMTLLYLATEAKAVTVAVVASRDTTLYQTDDGSLCNGAGIYLFAGRTGQLESESRRRALLYFNLAGRVPPGSTIESATLKLYMSRTPSASELVAVHRVDADWGEGASDAPDEEGGGTACATGDASWLHTFFNTDLWSTPGGDFAATASALLGVVGIGSYTWPSTSAMIDDVQSWVDNPDLNFGWILVGFEGAALTAKRFDSRENAIAANRPVLTVKFTPPNIPTASDIWLAVLAVAISITGAMLAKTRSLDGKASKS